MQLACAGEFSSPSELSKVPILKGPLPVPPFFMSIDNSFRLLAGPLTPRLLEWLANWLPGLIVSLLIHHPYSQKRHILKMMKVVYDFINNFSYQRVSHYMRLLCSHMGRLTFCLSFAVLSSHWPHNYHSSWSPGIPSLPASPWGNSCRILWHMVRTANILFFVKVLC